MRVTLDRWTRSVLCVLVVSGSIACATRDYQAVKALRASYEQCVEDESESDPRCEALLAELQVAERRYEAGARRAWGCTPADVDCPVPR